MQINDRVENPAKKFLQRYIWLRKRRDALCAEIREHYASATRCTVQLSPIRTGGAGAYDHMAEEICRIVDTRDRLNDCVCRLDEQLREILSAIDSVSDERYKTVLQLRYINGYSWQRIENAMNYEATQVFVLHGRALLEINDWLERAE